MYTISVTGKVAARYKHVHVSVVVPIAVGFDCNNNVYCRDNKVSPGSYGRYAPFLPNSHCRHVTVKIEGTAIAVISLRMG